MAYNHFRLKDAYRRRYVFTKTKAFFAFVLSALISVVLTAFFEKYGEVLLTQIERVITGSAVVVQDVASKSSRAANPSDMHDKLQQLLGEMKKRPEGSH